MKTYLETAVAAEKPRPEIVQFCLLHLTASFLRFQGATTMTSP